MVRNYLLIVLEKLSRYDVIVLKVARNSKLVLVLSEETFKTLYNTGWESFSNGTQILKTDESYETSVVVFTTRQSILVGQHTKFVQKLFRRPLD